MESPSRSAGLTAQLQALRKALYHKYVQEVAALKEQHDRELRRLKERDSDGEVERTEDRERLEEEVAKVGRKLKFGQNHMY